MSHQQPSSLVPNDPYAWHESVLSTRSLSYMSTISALGNAALPSPLAARGMSHLISQPQSIMDEDSEYELEMADRRVRAKTVREVLPTSVAHSILFTIPRELRERMYQHCLVADGPVEWPTATPYILVLAPQLLRTCKTIFAEAAPVMYASNQFSFSHPTDANIFVRAVTSPLHSGMLTKLTFHMRSQDCRLWMAYFSSNSNARSLKHDFPCIRELTVRYKSVRWSNMASVDTNMRMWYEDKHLDELIDSLRQIYYPPFAHLNSAGLDDKQLAALRQYEDVDSEMQDSLRDAAVREKLQELRELQRAALQQARAPRIRIICMCRVHRSQFQTLTSPESQDANLNATAQNAAPQLHQHPAIVQRRQSRPSPVPVREGDEFFGFTAIDLKDRAWEVTDAGTTKGSATWAARTVFLNRKNIMLALEIFSVD